MNSKVTAFVSYLTWVGFIIAVVAGEKDSFSRHHINQAFVLWLFGTISTICMKVLGLIPIIKVVAGLLFGIIDVALGILCLIGIICALMGSDYKIPVIGDIHIFN